MPGRRRDRRQPRKRLDRFVLHELEAKRIAPSPAADPRTLIQRAYLDLTGLRPSYEQVEAFAASPTDEAYERILEQLLASPQYGQRWGRYWLDVARYGDDNPTSEATNPPVHIASLAISGLGDPLVHEPRCAVRPDS